jgi:hypothetical protein
MGMLPSGENACVLSISTIVQMQLMSISDPRTKTNHPKVCEKMITIRDVQAKKEYALSASMHDEIRERLTRLLLNFTVLVQLNQIPLKYT